VNNTLLKNVFTPWAAFVAAVATITQSPNRWTRPMFVWAFHGYFGEDFAGNGIRVFHEHYAMVRSMVPKERLLEYQVKEGWGPLCDFLECPVPAEEFPNGNQHEETEKRIHGLVNSEVARLGRLAAAMAVGLLAAWAVIASTTSHVSLFSQARRQVDSIL
jgi:hypothetical protein